jgi:hypothetical protein
MERNKSLTWRLAVASSIARAALWQAGTGAGSTGVGLLVQAGAVVLVALPVRLLAAGRGVADHVLALVCSRHRVIRE